MGADEENLICSLTQVLLIQSYTYFTHYKGTMLIF